MAELADIARTRDLITLMGRLINLILKLDEAAAWHIRNTFFRHFRIVVEVQTLGPLSFH